MTQKTDTNRYISHLWACGAAFAVCGALDRCMELEAMYRKGWQDAEKLVQWYRAAKAEA